MFIHVINYFSKLGGAENILIRLVNNSKNMNFLIVSVLSISDVL